MNFETLATITVVSILIVIFWPRRRAHEPQQQAPIEPRESRVDRILRDTLLTEVTCKQSGPNLYIDGSFLQNGYVRRSINVQVRGIPDNPMNPRWHTYTFNHHDMINKINEAIKKAPQWNY